MSTEKRKPTGGFAFPTGGCTPGLDPCGMTLRDYFAAKAMQGMFANGEGNFHAVVRDAYQIADAMLEARK